MLWLTLSYRDCCDIKQNFVGEQIYNNLHLHVIPLFLLVLPLLWNHKKESHVSLFLSTLTIQPSNPNQSLHKPKQRLGADVRCELLVAADLLTHGV